MTGLVLASASPRRRELLGRLVSGFGVVAADLDESPLPGEHPARYVERLARAKAEAVAATTGAAVIGADTTVDVDGTIFGKAGDRAEARAMLRALSGRSHLVHTGVAVVAPAAGEGVGPAGRTRAGTAGYTSASCGRMTVAATVTATVRFTTLDDARIAWYLDTGEWGDKAGAYAIQGAGGALVARVDGSVSGIVGLPLAELASLCEQVGFPLF